MDFLKTHHYNVIGFDELVEGIRNNKKFPPKTVVLSFDDGYENNYTAAFPILKEYGFPAIIFLCSDFIGEKDFLTWLEIKEMQKHKIIMGGHTRRHVYLPDAPLTTQRDEIFGCKATLESKLGPVDFFAYPVGGYNEEVKILVGEAGFKAACTTNRGNKRLNKDLYALKRIRLTDHDLGISLWFKFSGFYNQFRSLKPPHEER